MTKRELPAATAAIALGANATSAAGVPERTLAAALEAMAAADLRPFAVSRFWRSPAWPAGSGPDFVNAVALVRLPAAPGAVLDRLHGIEAAFGRVRRERWGPRTLDLDLLLAGDAVLPDEATVRRWITLPDGAQRREAPEALILPHPRLQDRGFVLAPLSEVLPGWRHPLSGLTVAGMLARLPAAATAGLRPFVP
ncbi:MAG: 2-amino-4-hydroxy-6-hydroxymethyldihydropteridine diphosphokinase [Rhodobacteraceae bacterium]|nr:2-amino-4-hydroxy-6-hydroxymethyldihydropteridine diphosphokinase [Paracoccaceae bacterium]